jgi:predicted TIM-barrel enzyme
MRLSREVVVSRLRSEIARGRPIIGAGAGTGLSAASAEAGGVDLIIVYNSGRFRMAARSSAAGLLPYGDANAIVVEMAREILPVVERTPVLAGVCGTDPFRDMPAFLEELIRLGYSGVQNFPTVGLFDGAIRATFEETGLGFDREVEMIRAAHDLDLVTTPYVFDPAQACTMAQAGADVIVSHLGTTVGGALGARTGISLDEAAARVAAMSDAAKAVNPAVVVLCHGGPIAEPEDARAVLDRVPGVVGFFGASSIERLPVERAIAENIRNFKSITSQVRTRRAAGA